MAPATRRSFPWLRRGPEEGQGRWWRWGGLGWVGWGRDDFWGRQRCLTGLRGAVKTKPLINDIDQQKNRGKCDLHTAPVINALTDFFFPLPPPTLWNLISWVFKVREREFRLMSIDRCLSQTRIQSILLAGEGWNIPGQKTQFEVGLCIYVSL